MDLKRKLLGMFLVALGDFASGALIAHILVRITGYDGMPILEVDAIGAMLAVLPDLDILLQYLMVSDDPEDISKHRDMLHRPLYLIPIFIGLYLFFSSFWAYMIALCILAHIIHDSMGSGYGVKWLQPFSQNTYKLCTRKIICMWTKKYVEKHPITETLDEALEKYYLKPTLEGLSGVVFAVIAIIVILFR